MRAMLLGLPSDFSGNFEKPLIAVPCLRWERHPSSAGKHRVWLEVSVWVAQSCLGFPSAEQLCQLSFQITDSNLAFISNLSIISPHKKGEVNKDTSDREKTLDINLFIFPAGSAAVFSEQHWIRARRLVEPQAPEGCCTGRLEQHKELPTPHLEKAPTGAQAMAMPSVFCWADLLSWEQEKSWHMEVGFQFPAAWRLDADCWVVPVETSLHYWVSFPLFQVFCFQNSSFLYLPHCIILPSIPSRQGTMDSFFLFSLGFILFSCLTLSLIFCLLEGCVINWQNISLNNYFPHAGCSLGHCGDFLWPQSIGTLTLYRPCLQGSCRLLTGVFWHEILA